MFEFLQNILSEESLQSFYDNRNAVLLFGLIILLLGVLGKAADRLVGEAVVLSDRSGLPKVVIGATIVSLGTTTPETAVSVLAALQGDPGLALGNAVGSIICDTGLILGIACLIDPPKLPPVIVNRQGWLQLAAGVLLVVACWPAIGVNPFTEGGYLSQVDGLVFVALLAGYLWLSVRWTKEATDDEIVQEIAELEQETGDLTAPLWTVVLKLLVSIVIVVLTSHLLIPAVSEAAERLGVPSAIIAASLVAFGTSLPELVTAVTASFRGHGDLAVGNVIGADILNVLWVSGLSAAVTPIGLHAPPEFFRVLFPAMLLVLLVFRIGVATSGERLSRGFGCVLVATYLITMLASFVFLPSHG